MKGKLMRGAAFFAVALLLFCGLNWRFTQTDYYQEMDDYFLYEHLPDEIDIITLGSSHTRYAVDFRGYTEFTGVNFAQQGKCPNSDVLYLESFGERLRPGATVIITMSYFSLYADDGLIGGQKVRQYKYLKPDLIEDYDLGFDLMYHHFPVLTAKTRLMDCFLPNGRRLWSYGLQGTLPATYDDLVPAQIDGWFNVYMPNGQVINEKQWQASRRMLELCRENGWRAVIMVPPMPDGVQRALPKGFLAQFHKDLGLLLANDANVPVWDYSVQQRFSMHPELFADTEHLREEGGIAFTAALVEDCKAAGYL